jgi:predicted CoA-substrate-specific enzyme activase
MPLRLAAKDKKISMGYYAGIDIGSLTCEAAIVEEAGQVLASEIVLTGARSRAAIERALSGALEQVHLRREDLAALIATGYGRDRVEGRTRSVTEITCHARGAFHLFPGTRLVLDVGGQDCKAIRLDRDGRVLDFAMNDKCAAGTGRFFEVMARALEVDLDDLGGLALRATRILPLSNVCTVFAESEVVSLVAQEESVENIAAGLCGAAAERVRSLAQRVGVAEEVTATGGAAKNVGFVRALERLLGVPVNVPAEPQIVGALGAALMGREGN